MRLYVLFWILLPHYFVSATAGEKINDEVYGWHDGLIDEYCSYTSYVLTCGLEWITLKPLGKNNYNTVSSTAIIREANFYLKPINVLKKNQVLFGKEKYIEKLVFYSTNITTIEPNAFENFQALKDLQLKTNEITNIDETILTPKLGETLLKLDLANNPLQNLSSNVFVNMKKLIELSLEGIQTIDTSLKNNNNIFSDSLSNLKTLNLMFCNISSFPENIFINLTRLEVLELQGNPLSSIPKAIKHLKNLKYLSIGGSNIVELKHQQNVFNFNLEALDFFRSQNLLEINDCAFCNFPNLKNISFWESRKLSKIHENAFGKLTLNISTEIKKFNIQQCNISSLSQKMLNWNSVNELFLSKKSMEL